MHFLQAVKLAFGGIRTNKMRSFLTMLGVIIGVGAVIILVSIGEGSTRQVTEQIQGLGSNLITVSVTGRGGEASFTDEDITNLGGKLGVKAIAPVVNGNVTAKYGTKSIDTSLEGVTPEYDKVRNVKVSQGRFLIPADIQYRNKVAVIGTDVVDQLFATVNPIGKNIKINGSPFEVVGVLEKKGGQGFGSQDDKVVIPLTVAQRLLGTTDLRSVYVQAEDPESVDLVVQQMELYLLKKFKDSDYYRIFNQADILSTVGQVTGTLTLMLGGIAGISLFAGGIGIMNIMLVSVTERTREIGIRKAIGAKKRDILAQFLIESMVISGMGGVIGILLGLGGSSLVGKITGMSVSVSTNIIILSFSFAIFVGVTFGIYPANKAAKLNPIEALRHE